MSPNGGPSVKWIESNTESPRAALYDISRFFEKQLRLEVNADKSALAQPKGRNGPLITPT